MTFSDLIHGDQKITSGYLSHHDVDCITSEHHSRCADNVSFDAVLVDWDIKWVTVTNSMSIIRADHHLACLVMELMERYLEHICSI